MDRISGFDAAASSIISAQFNNVQQVLKLLYIQLVTHLLIFLTILILKELKINTDTNDCRIPHKQAFHFVFCCILSGSYT